MSDNIFIDYQESKLRKDRLEFCSSKLKKIIEKKTYSKREHNDIKEAIKLLIEYNYEIKKML